MSVMAILVLWMATPTALQIYLSPTGRLLKKDPAFLLVICEKMRFSMITGCNNTLYNINIQNDEIDPVIIEFSKKRISLTNDSFINKQCDLNTNQTKNQYYVNNKVILDTIIRAGIY